MLKQLIKPFSYDCVNIAIAITIIVLMNFNYNVYMAIQSHDTSPVVALLTFGISSILGVSVYLVLYSAAKIIIVYFVKDKK